MGIEEDIRDIKSQLYNLYDKMEQIAVVLKKHLEKEDAKDRTDKEKKIKGTLGDKPTF
jgi:hypothetical protein